MTCRAVAACIAGSTLFGVSAYGQQAPAASSATDSTQLEEVIVTGSMIRRPSAETTEAVTVLRSDALRDQGVVNLEQAVATLTSATPSITLSQSVGTFSGGGTYANLRGLGNGRTLVLLDGQRLANNANSGNAVDLSGIPFSAIGSVEVLREGASALYGSDAIAGVLNFITKKNYQGAEVQANFNHPEKSGGASGEADFTFGHGDLADDGYNFMVTGSYTKQKEIRATQRAFSASGYDPERGVFNTNDPGTWPGSVLDSNGNLFQYGFPTCAGNPLLTTDSGDCAYRYSAATDLIPESSAYSAMAAFTKTLPGNNRIELQYFFTRAKATGYSGPMFYQYTMDPASPYRPNPSQLTCIGDCGGLAPALNDPVTGDPLDIDAIWTDPNNSRYNGTINTEQRVLLTFAGNNAGWDYEASLNLSQNKNVNRNTGGYPDETVQAPNGVLSVLINPFGPQSAAGQALIDQSYVNGVYANGKDKRWSVDAHASHELGDAFNSGNPATVALGATVAGERFEYATTPYNTLTQAATGLTDSDVAGSRRNQAIYVELDVPISKTLDLDISDREDRYSDFGNTNNAKLGLRYQPFSFLTFRGTASTGFRAPTLFNLYSPNFLAASSSGTIGQNNPFCKPGAYNAQFTPAVCSSQGLGLYGGNVNLTPETSQNFDLGVIVSPIQDLGITIDYYRILLKNTIGAIPTSAIYGNPTEFASSYVLNSAGSLTSTIAESQNCLPSYTLPTCGYILKNSLNTGRITTDGIDVSVQYRQNTPIGTFREDIEGTAVTHFDQQTYAGGPMRNLAGWYNQNYPAFKWQHNVRVDWTSPEGMFGGGLSNRFYSGYIDQFKDGNGDQRYVGSYSLVDGYVSVKPIDSLTVLFGIKNILDRSPPFTNASQGNFAAGYDALTADPLLRNFYINVKYKIF